MLKVIMLKLNTKGFSAIELSIIAVIALLVILVGWLQLDYHKKLTTKHQLTNISINQNGAWQSFCSNYGGLCLKFPPNWTQKSTLIPEQNGSATVGETTMEDMTSPGAITVEYVPSCVQAALPTSASWSDNIISITTPAAATDFRIVKAISTFKTSGKTIIADSLYLTTAALVAQNGLTAGNHSSNSAQYDEAVNGYFNNAKANTPANLECLNVGTLNSTTETNSVSFKNTSQAKAWFNIGDVKTAEQVLNTISYNQ